MHIPAETGTKQNQTDQQLQTYSLIPVSSTKRAEFFIDGKIM